MAVKDFMTKRVVYVSPETTVAAAADIMRDKGLRRLPVIEHDKLVGLIQIGGRVGRSPDRPTGKLYFFHEGLSKSMLRCREEIKVMNKKGGFNNEVSTM